MWWVVVGGGWVEDVCYLLFVVGSWVLSVENCLLFVVYCLLKDRLVQGIVCWLLFIDLTTRCTKDVTKDTRKEPFLASPSIPLPMEREALGILDDRGTLLHLSIEYWVLIIEYFLTTWCTRDLQRTREKIWWGWDEGALSRLTLAPSPGGEGGIGHFGWPGNVASFEYWILCVDHWILLPKAAARAKRNGMRNI